jgi:proliferating cell nuclear antigen
MPSEVKTKSEAKTKVVSESKSKSKYDKYAMYFSTVQGAPIKTLTEALKEVLQDTNIHFNNEGIEIVNVDPDNIAFVSLKLIGSRFEEYHCPSPLMVGVNMAALHKLLKTIGNNDTLTMYVLKEDKDRLGIVIQNEKRRMNNTIIYNLKDIDESEIDIPDVQFDTHVTMPCSDFQKYCRELASIAELVTIRISPEKVFSMIVNGKMASQTLDMEESNDSNVVIDINENIDEDANIGTFSLKFLNLFCKSSTLCNTIQLYMTVNDPIIIVYSVASLGTVKFCLVPNTEESEED